MPKTLRPHYEEAVRYYREHPGDVMGCAKATGVDWRTSSRWWKGPQRPGTPWAVPIQDVLALEKQRAEEDRDERQAALRAELIEQQAKTRAAQDEAERLDEAVIKLARSDVLGALGGLARLTGGINKLAERVNRMLETGLDAAGNTITISPAEALRIIQRYATATKGLTEAAQVLVGIERTKAGLPTAIVGIDVANVSLEEAIAQHELAGEMIADAKRLGILPSTVDVGAPSRRPSVLPAGAPVAGPVVTPSRGERH